MPPRAARRARRGLAALVAATLLAPVAGGPGGPTAEAAPTATWQRTWTVEVPGADIFESSPLPVDLDGDGVLDVVVGGLDGQVRALSGRDGRTLPGWPRAAGRGISSSPSAADTDGDGHPEVFVGAGTDGHGGGLLGFQHDGTPRFAFRASDRVCAQARCGFDAPGVHSSPALGDVDRDGRADVTFGTLGLRSIWSLTESGAARAGFPLYSDDTVFSSPALADLDGDGTTDVVIGTDSTAGGPVDHRGGILRALRGDGTQLWEARMDEIIRSSPSVGDIDGDGKPEVVVGTGDFYLRQPGGATDHTWLYAFERDGRLQWKVDTGGTTSASPALADVTGDGRLDVVIGTGTRGASRGGRIKAYDGATGRQVYDSPASDHHTEDIIGAVSTADVDGDGHQDVFATTGSGVYLRSGRTGLLLASFDVGQVGYQNTPAVTDVDGDGHLDLLLAGRRPDGTGVISRHELSSTVGRTGPGSWPQFRHDARRTGNATPPPLTQTLCRAGSADGYWLVARDGGVFAYCGAGFHGSAGSLRLNQPVVGMAATPSRTGYWLVARDGGIFSYGDAGFHGSTGAIRLNQPVVGMAATPGGRGYWLVAADGGIFSYGDAGFFGSTGAMALRSPIVGMAPTPSGKGYWLVARDGGVFAYGDAGFHGAAASTPLSAPVIGLAPSRSGRGYRLATAAGQVLAYGDAPAQGSLTTRPNLPVVAVAGRSSTGFYLTASDGGVFAFGAPFLGSTGGTRLNQPVVGMATRG